MTLDVQLHELFDRIGSCEYLDKEPIVEDDDDDEVSGRILGMAFQMLCL